MSSRASPAAVRAAGRRVGALPSLGRCQRRRLSSTAPAGADFTHAVIGGGVVGVAVARQLARRAGTSTLLVERHGAAGTETTARNSEVMHAGLYYGAHSLKARLCIRGRRLLYALCARHGVAHRATGKWIVAQTEPQRAALERLHALARDRLGVPLRWLSRAEVRRDGEGVRADAGALDSPETGIVDAHALVVCLLGLFEDAGGVIALRAPVTAVRPLGAPPGSAGWEVDVRDAGAGAGAGADAGAPAPATTTVTAECLVNATGLGAVAVHNMIVPPARRRRLFFAKGNYFSYAAARPRVSRLIYPAPEPGAGGLGTHLTLDLAGRLRFGPDVEWVDRPDDLAVSPARLPAAAADIARYLPAIDPAALAPDYAGIRPKLSDRAAVAAGHAFSDFHIAKEDGYEAWVNLLGIESPGLTSCLAIAEMVEQLLHGGVSR